VGDFVDIGGALDDRTRPRGAHEVVGLFTNAAPGRLAASATSAATPSVRVGPGSTAFTVTPVPARRLARPWDTARLAALVTP
jgi:hypothetical protein